MTDKTNHVEKLEWIVEQLADSVLELSDEAILAEVRESGADPQEEAERIRLGLRQVSSPEVANSNARCVNTLEGQCGDGRTKRSQSLSLG